MTALSKTENDLPPTTHNPPQGSPTDIDTHAGAHTPSYVPRLWENMSPPRKRPRQVVPPTTTTCAPAAAATTPCDATVPTIVPQGTMSCTNRLVKPTNNTAWTRRCHHRLVVRHHCTPILHKRSFISSRQHNKIMMWWTVMTLFLGLWGQFLLVTAAVSNNHDKQEINFLSQDSVVLIVGATTSLLGSEVALALYRLFQCQVVLMDELDTTTTTTDENNKIADELFHLEFQRQSLFRVWQELAEDGDHHLAVYRMNPRPIIPDIDPGTTVDRLAHVFDQHQPTHILVFPTTPECYRGETDDAPPRAGMLEGILEHVLWFQTRYPNATTPRVVWTSSEAVYPPNGRWKETDIPPVPDTKEGANAMVDEVVARSYDDKGIPSIALRIAKHVYGPFQGLTTPLFTLMERRLNPNKQDLDRTNFDDGDFLYVDDAVDAVLGALQLPNTPSTFALNVGSGDPILTMDQVQAMIQQVVDGKPIEGVQETNENRRLDISLAKQLLNFNPRVSLTEGFQRTLAWHYDRLFPYGMEKSDELSQVRKMSRMYGIASCTDASDTECLQGMTVLPCASECSHPNQCRSSAWDELLPQLESWTEACPVVLYTIRQDVTNNLFNTAANSNGIWPDPHCNVAFVPTQGQSEIHVEQMWTVVSINTHFSDLDTWLMPLWSPGKLFPRSQWAIYSAQNVLWDDLNRLMDAVQAQPKAEASGQVGLMMGYPDVRKDRPQNPSQQQAYRTIRIKLGMFLKQDWLHDGFLPPLDAESWIVHRLGHQDSEQLRCDVTKEISGWKGVVDFQTAASFVFGVHDLLSQALVGQSGKPAWWYVDRRTANQSSDARERRLQEESDDGSYDGDDGTHSDGGLDFMEGEETSDSHNVLDSEEEEAEMQDVHHFDHNGFGVTRKSIGPGGSETEEGGKENADGGGTTTEEVEDERTQEVDDEKVDAVISEAEHSVNDPENDIWLGVLSSSALQTFVRLVPPRDVGALYVDDMDEATSK